ncbi:MAG: hypothetical protein WC389_13225 [Lutibacter sp.]|jgi:hypothetical protein
MFLRINDLMTLTGTTEGNCKMIMRHLHDVLGKKKLINGRYQKVTIKEYCAYEGLIEDDVLIVLKLKKV